MIDDTVRWLESKQPKHEDPLTDPVRFERYFSEIFQPEKRQRLDQEQFDHGCRDGDFA